MSFIGRAFLFTFKSGKNLDRDIAVCPAIFLISKKDVFYKFENVNKEENLGHCIHEMHSLRFFETAECKQLISRKRFPEK